MRAFVFVQRMPRRTGIVFIATTGRRVAILKRVLDLPREEIFMRDGIVYANNNLACELYSKPENGRPIKNSIRLKENKY